MLERLGVWAVLAVAFFGMVCLTMNAVSDCGGRVPTSVSELQADRWWE